jgi:hypothetical protein
MVVVIAVVVLAVVLAMVAVAVEMAVAVAVVVEAVEEKQSSWYFSTAPCLRYKGGVTVYTSVAENTG